MYIVSGPTQEYFPHGDIIIYCCWNSLWTPFNQEGRYLYCLYKMYQYHIWSSILIRFIIKLNHWIFDLFTWFSVHQIKYTSLYLQKHPIFPLENKESIQYKCMLFHTKFLIKNCFVINTSVIVTHLHKLFQCCVFSYLDFVNKNAVYIPVYCTLL